MLSLRTRMHQGRTLLLGHICQKLAPLLPGCLLSLHGCSQAGAQVCKLRGGVVLHQLQAVGNTPVLCCLHKCTHKSGLESYWTGCLHVQLKAPKISQVQTFAPGQPFSEQLVVQASASHTHTSCRQQRKACACTCRLLATL